jgi:zinc transport system ATP-binding protein
MQLTDQINYNVTIDQRLNMEAIKINNLWAGYDKQSVLEDINLTVKEYDFIGIIGPNGGGKTTLIKVLLGLITPSHGEILIMGKNVIKGRRNIGYVPQSIECDRQFPINVWEVVKMGTLGNRNWWQRYNKKYDHIIAEALEKVEMLHLRKRPIGELSGGQRQRVYIARALVSQPQILLLDEPTASVDPHGSASIYELLQKLNKHLTILMISHDMGAISSYVKTVGCLNRRLFYHGDRLITKEMLEKTYQCPIDLIAHGLPHRVLPDHCCSDHEG